MLPRQGRGGPERVWGWAPSFLGLGFGKFAQVLAAKPRSWGARPGTG